MRKVELHGDIPGELYIHGLPGRQEPLDLFCAAISEKRISRIICLVSDTEVLSASPKYGRAIDLGHLPCPVESFPITDFGVPHDQEKFDLFIERLVERLKAGERVLIHCLWGCGRSGLVAICALISLGILCAEAEEIVAMAGSHPESPQQLAFIERFAQRRLP